MWEYNYVTNTTELYHHGIKGQKWGVRRYQNLDRTLTEEGKLRYNKGGGRPRGKQGDISTAYNVAVAVTTAAAIGKKIYEEYKTGAFVGNKLKTMQKYGKYEVDRLLAPERAGIKRLERPENLTDTLKNTNPLKGRPEAANNCTFCSIAGELRRRGYDVTAKPSVTGNYTQERIWEVFKNAEVKYAKAGRFGKSPAEASKMLVEQFGENASGAVGVQWKNAGIGHCFAWRIENGKVTFVDYQQGTKGRELDWYWDKIDRKSLITVARLDNLEPNWSTITNVVDGGHRKENRNVQE